MTFRTLSPKPTAYGEPVSSSDDGIIFEEQDQIIENSPFEEPNPTNMTIHISNNHEDEPDHPNDNDDSMFCNNNIDVKSPDGCSKEAARAARREKYRQKDRFLLFTRVLVKYLEQVDPTLHEEVREIIRDCTEKKARHEPGYESVTVILRQRLKETVNDAYWLRAEMYLEKFLKEKAMMASVAKRMPAVRRGSMSSIRTCGEDTVTSETTDSISMASSSVWDPSDNISCLTHNTGQTTSSSPTGKHHNRWGMGANLQIRREKEMFIIFMRILVKYLEHKDPDLYVQVRDMIQDCAARNQRHESGFESVTEAVRERLLIIVPDHYWKHAQRLHEQHCIREKSRNMHHHHAAPTGTSWRSYCRRSSF